MTATDWILILGFVVLATMLGHVRAKLSLISGQMGYLTSRVDDLFYLIKERAPGRDE